MTSGAIWRDFPPKKFNLDWHLRNESSSGIEERFSTLYLNPSPVLNLWSNSCRVITFCACLYPLLTLSAVHISNSWFFIWKETSFSNPEKNCLSSRPPPVHDDKSFSSKKHFRSHFLFTLNSAWKVLKFSWLMQTVRNLKKILDLKEPLRCKKELLRNRHWITMNKILIVYINPQISANLTRNGWNKDI